MILLASDHVEPSRACEDDTLDNELKEFYENGYFEDEECRTVTNEGAKVLRPFIEDYEEKIKIEIEACKKMDEEQSIRELTEKLELDQYSNGELLVKCMLHRLENRLENLSIEVSKIKRDTFTVKEKPIHYRGL